METWAVVKSMRHNPNALLFGRCEHCGKRHAPPYSYWFAVWSFLSGLSR